MRRLIPGRRAAKTKNNINLTGCCEPSQNVSIMNINLQTVKFDADRKLVEFIEKKLSKLERFAERATGADVILKLEKDAEKGNKVVSITIHNPGGELMTEQRAKTFEEAVDAALDVLKRQAEKNKEKAARG